MAANQGHVPFCKEAHTREMLVGVACKMRIMMSCAGQVTRATRCPTVAAPAGSSCSCHFSTHASPSSSTAAAAGSCIREAQLLPGRYALCSKQRHAGQQAASACDDDGLQVAPITAARRKDRQSSGRDGLWPCPDTLKQGMPFSQWLLARLQGWVLRQHHVSIKPRCTQAETAQTSRKLATVAVTGVTLLAAAAVPRTVDIGDAQLRSRVVA